MAHTEETKVDAVTGQSTTGHSWDGIEELNTPLPRWWLWLFYVTIVWAIGYWVLYPAWPMMQSYTGGVLGWNSRSAVQQEVAQGQQDREKNPAWPKLVATPLDQIIADYQKGQNQDVYNFAAAKGKAAFADNCAPCHGSGAQGSSGYPNLNDNVWLWGGTPDEIQTTIRYGVRSGDPKSEHLSQMTAFGKEGMLTAAQISTVADFVLSKNGMAPKDSKVDMAAGQKIFEENCVACHGEQGQGMKEMGTPNLMPLMVNGKPAPKVWLYSATKEQITHALTNGLGNVMPAWEDRLDATTIKALTLYVVSLGGADTALLNTGAAKQ